MRAFRITSIACATTTAALIVAALVYRHHLGEESTTAGTYDASIWQCACRDGADLIVVDGRAYLYIPYHKSLRPFGEIDGSSWRVPQGFTLDLDARVGGIWVREPTTHKAVFLARKAAHYDVANVLATTDAKDITKYLKPSFFISTLDPSRDR
jgi:hypothetical protein